MAHLCISEPVLNVRSQTAVQWTVVMFLANHSKYFPIWGTFLVAGVLGRGCPPIRKPKEKRPSFPRYTGMDMCMTSTCQSHPPAGTAVLEGSAKPGAREKLLRGQQIASLAPFPMAPSWSSVLWPSCQVCKLSDLILIQSLFLSLCIN